jgi:hypothetical protein
MLVALAAAQCLLYAQRPNEYERDLNCDGGVPSKNGFVPLVVPCPAGSQKVDGAWSGYGRDPQHTATSAQAAQTLSSIHWQTPVDLNPPGGGTGPLLVHYGSPVITPGNTIIVPVKTGATDGFQLEAFSGATGSPIYTLPSDYSLPVHNWTPPYAPALALSTRPMGTRLYYAGAGGTIYYRDLPDSATGPNGHAGATGQVAFFGTALYNNNQAAFDSAVQISTPLTADHAGNVFFGFTVTGSNPARLVSGIARVSPAGVGTWISAVPLTGDLNDSQIALNCAPALSNDQRTVYVAVSSGIEFGTGYLTSLNASTLAPIAHVQLLDPRGGAATVSQDSSASPMVGPDGDVYYGVLENPCCTSHNDRGWMLHFDSTLTQTKTPGSFGWDDTASVAPSSAVPSYTGRSPYLILTKYNNYVGAGAGNGVNKVGVLDPSANMQDEYSSTPVTVMKEVITVTGVTPDPTAGFPNAVREWCINTAAIDPFTKSAIINSEDGVVYRWDFTTNTLLQSVRLTGGLGEAYTPTVIGPDGIVYAINDAILFAIGN